MLERAQGGRLTGRQNRQLASRAAQARHPFSRRRRGRRVRSMMSAAVSILTPTTDVYLHVSHMQEYRTARTENRRAPERRKALVPFRRPRRVIPLGLFGKRVASRGVCDGLPGGTFLLEVSPEMEERTSRRCWRRKRHVAPLLSIAARVEAILPTLAQGSGASSRDARRWIDKRI